MIIDTSAFMAILLQEPECEPFLGAIRKAPARSMSAGGWIELGAVLTQKGDQSLPALATRILDGLSIQLESVTPEQARIGHEAYRRFGKGQHKAGLNFGDCLAYALAKATGRPLLFKGEDFIHTDILPAM